MSLWQQNGTDPRLLETLSRGGETAPAAPSRTKQLSNGKLAGEPPGQEGAKGAILISPPAQADDIGDGAGEAATERRAELRSMAIHDMKSSLVLIGGFLQRLFSGQEATPESRRKYLEIIKKEQCKLEALLNDIEVCPEITGRLRLECRPIAVDRELADLCEAYQLKAARKRTSLNLSKPSLPVLVLADSRRLHRAFANLLDNSFKFSATGSAIRVAIQQAGNEVSISFADDGPGIDPRDLPYLFNAHYRGRAGHRTEGSGLGLAAVKVIVEAHGGRVLAENRPGGGALFTVILPTGNGLHTDQAEGFRPSLQQDSEEKPLLRVVNARP